MSLATVLRRKSRRGAGCVAALLLAAAAASPPAPAGEAASVFQVTIRYAPEATGTCSASATGGPPQVTCRPSLIDDSPLTAYRKPSEPSLRLAGELVEVGEENHYAWTQGSYLAWGEYSSRLVVAGGIEYVEMTLAW